MPFSLQEAIRTKCPVRYSRRKGTVISTCYSFYLHFSSTPSPLLVVSQQDWASSLHRCLGNEQSCEEHKQNYLQPAVCYLQSKEAGRFQEDANGPPCSISKRPNEIFSATSYSRFLMLYYESYNIKNSLRVIFDKKGSFWGHLFTTYFFCVIFQFICMKIVTILFLSK